VNLAARLETMSHFSDQTRILVDEQTKLAASAAFSFKNHGELPVKGKTALVQVYELHD
jgi:class 3 adenylate cyclase